MIGVIEIDNMEFHSNHGCFEEEKIIGNLFLVSMKVGTDVSKAMDSDNIEDALNYQALYDIVKIQMDKTSNLLEHVAGRILKAIDERFGKRVTSVIITVSKINPPLGGKLEKVSLTLHK